MFYCSPRIAKAAAAEASKTTLADLAPIGMTLLKVAGAVFVLGTGNLVLAGLAYYYYRNYHYQKKTLPSDVIMK